MRFIFLTVCVAYSLMLSASQALIGNEEMLKLSDIHKVMEQIFEQHVDKKEMTAEILSSAVKNYLNQFDPMRIYLLESEVRPFVQLTHPTLVRLLEQYNHQDLATFTALNDLIQQSIVRARQNRKEIDRNRSQLFQATLDTGETVFESLHDQELKRAFASTPAELKTRIQQDAMLFIHEEIKRFGEGQVMRDEVKTLKLYDEQARHLEDQYLGVDEAGAPLPAIEKENLFALHVLKALAATLDAHTRVMNNTEAYDLKVRLEKEFEGVGVRLREQNNTTLVGSLIPGSPAALSKEIQVGDRIMEINGHSTDHEPLDRVLEMLRGKSTPTVTLSLQRGSNRFSVELKRAVITINEGRVESSYEVFGNGIIGRITLHMFYQGDNGISSAQDVLKAIQELQKKGNLRGLVLDLRDNAGGFLMQAVRVAGLFISSGVIVVSKYSNGEEQFYRDVDGKAAFDGPLVLLTSRWTASAAEIVSQALQDYGVALVVGDEQTYGKGTIQSQTVTGNNTSQFFKVTVGKYYTVSGKTPQLQGVKADILVPSRYNHEAIGEEFLDKTIPPDTIPPSYEDKLADIPPSQKEWYLHYYAPLLQHKKMLWRAMLPSLKTNSGYRISNNKNYQAWLKLGEEEDRESETLTPDFGEDDLQVVEAVNIVKDMILLQSRMRNQISSTSPTPVGL